MNKVCFLFIVLVTFFYSCNLTSDRDVKNKETKVNNNLGEPSSVFDSSYYSREVLEDIIPSENNLLSSFELIDKYNLGAGHNTINGGSKYKDSIIDSTNPVNNATYVDTQLVTELKCKIIKSKDGFYKSVNNNGDGSIDYDTSLIDGVVYIDNTMYLSVEVNIIKGYAVLDDYVISDFVNETFKNKDHNYFLSIYGDAILRKVDVGTKYSYFLGLSPRANYDEKVMESILKYIFATKFLGLDKELSLFNEGITKVDLQDYSLSGGQTLAYGAPDDFSGVENKSLSEIKSFLLNKTLQGYEAVIKVHLEENPLFANTEDNYFNNIRTLKSYYKIIHMSMDKIERRLLGGYINDNDILVFDSSLEDISYISSYLDMYVEGLESFKTFDSTFLDKYYSYLE